MKLKEQTIQNLEKTNPLIAGLLENVDLEFDDSDSKLHPTVHLIGKKGAYFMEQLESRFVWPKVHFAISQILESDFTLNFKPIDKD